MVAGEEYFPVFLVWETDGVVFEMPIGINGFIIAIAPIHIRPGISRIVDDAKDAAVGQCPLCDLPIPCASISTLGEREIVFSEIPDNTVGASGGAECPKQGGEGMLYLFIRIHDGPTTGVIEFHDPPHQPVGAFRFQRGGQGVCADECVERRGGDRDALLKQ